MTPAEENPADESVITQIQPALLEVAPRVLVVDDDEIMVERLRELVTAAGFEVSSASNGAAARKARNRAVDCPENSKLCVARLTSQRRWSP